MTRAARPTPEELRASIDAAAARLEQRRAQIAVEPHRHGASCTTACPHYRPLDLWFHPGDWCPRTITPDKRTPPPCEGHALDTPELLRERSAQARAGRYVAEE